MANSTKCVCMSGGMLGTKKMKRGQLFKILGIILKLCSLHFEGAEDCEASDYHRYIYDNIKSSV